MWGTCVPKKMQMCNILIKDVYIIFVLNLYINVDNLNNLNHKCTKEMKPVKITQRYCSGFTECTKEIKL